MNEYIYVDYIKVKQPIGQFYVASMNYKDVLDIAKADVRMLANEDTIDTYIGIQRKISPKRVKEIADYSRTIDATFPTSIILAIKSINDDGQLNGNIVVEASKLKIKRSESVASILDGQHRLEGLKAAAKIDGEFELNVTIFIDPDIDDQAQIFSVINKAQTKVNKSLVYDLYEYAVHRSPQKTCHDIVRALNRNEKSPFYKKIKILGAAEDSEKETIAQATLVELIMRYVSRDPITDRDILRRASLFSSNKLNPPTESDQKELIFRDYFVIGNDSEITKIIYQYFSVVREKWPTSWSSNSRGNVLNKSTGIIALMKFLKPLFNRANDCNEDFNEFSKKYFRILKIEDDSIIASKYLPGTSGQSKLLNEMLDTLKTI